MTLNFGTDNVYYVPEGQPLIFFDIYDMRRLEFHIGRWGLFYNQARMEYITNAVNSARSVWSRHQGRNQETEGNLKKVQSFLSDFPRRPFPSTPPLDLKNIFSLRGITFWVRCSDTPLESFFEEDYNERPVTSGGAGYTPLMGAIQLSSIGDYELDIHEGIEPEGFFLEIPKGSITIASLPPEEILPLDEGFFGAFGSSGNGHVINLTHESKVSEENLVCVPFERIGEHYYATLYFHLGTDAEFDVIHRFHEKRLGFVRAAMSELGFKLVCDKNGNALYTRGNSHIHLYANATGKESAGSRFLNPFLLITCHEGESAPGKRSQLMEEIIPLFWR